MEIHAAEEADLPPARRWLAAQRLPVDVLDEHVATTVVATTTTTTEKFFPKLGFEPVLRADGPTSVQASIAFRSARPASALAMRKRLVSG
jgi:N-acetylglutamate synthase-like GNAT family acetyltransferase